MAIPREIEEKAYAFFFGGGGGMDYGRGENGE